MMPMLYRSKSVGSTRSTTAGECTTTTTSSRRLSRCWRSRATWPTCSRTDSIPRRRRPTATRLRPTSLPTRARRHLPTPKSWRRSRRSSSNSGAEGRNGENRPFPPSSFGFICQKDIENFSQFIFILSLQKYRQHIKSSEKYDSLTVYMWM